LAIARAANFRPRASWLVPLGFLVVVLGTLTAVIVLSQHVGQTVTRPNPPPFVPPTNDTTITRFDVKQAGGAQLTLAAPPVKGQAAPPDYILSSAASTRIVVLEPNTAATLPQPGEWVSVIGIPNEVRNFSIHSIVVLPPGGDAAANGVKRSPGGFAGNEAAPSGVEQVILGGTIERINGAALTLTGPQGPIQVQLTDRSPIFRLQAGSIDDVREGDSVAAKGLSGSAPPSAVLVQHAGK
jgi:hypothetical protein